MFYHRVHLPHIKTRSGELLACNCGDLSEIDLDGHGVGDGVAKGVEDAVGLRSAGALSRRSTLASLRTVLVLYYA